MDPSEREVAAGLLMILLSLELATDTIPVVAHPAASPLPGVAIVMEVLTVVEMVVV